MAERLAIVGGDAAGMSAASTARRREPDLDVVAFERGPYTSFSACGIPFYVGGLFEDSERLVTRSPDEHRERGIEVHTRTAVTAVDLDRRELTVRDQSGDERTRGLRPARARHGRRGRRARRPGRRRDRAGAHRSTPPSASAPALRARRRAARSSIGGGYIGLEMAEALVQRGLRVTLVERAGQVMATLDEDMAAHVQDAAEGVGIDVRLGAELQEVSEHAVRVDGEELPADHVVMATGVRPATGPRARRRASSSATAARCASTTTSAARATTASSPRATASSPGIGCSSGR